VVEVCHIGSFTYPPPAPQSVWVVLACAGAAGISVPAASAVIPLAAMVRRRRGMSLRPLV
jgi:hypothetical protein